jgi:hypothetical protein
MGLDTDPCARPRSTNTYQVRKRPREALEELQNLMAGGKELQDLSADLGGTV